ncbi:carboxypeptidase regulatory-like domain-containing protein [Acinetobacter courvalinii]|uniref:carboxypeptidase regulatory-like domain-containing protein n=1 Tax=Acinetobacter courvalinii TaxID=280147 RepID=UPI0028967CD4|nr:carboxypeptidase regulatory-like domain-containing protein [Acinetobacter courvalinii]
MLLNLNIINAICPNADSILTSTLGLSIKGQVKEKNIPIPCRVRLYERQSGRLIEDKLTENDGKYEFNHLTKVAFFIVAHHPLNTYNAVIADLVVPK